MESENKVEKGNNQKIILIIIIIALLIGGGIGFILLNKENNKQPDTPINQEEIENKKPEDTIAKEIHLKTDIRSLIYYSFGLTTVFDSDSFADRYVEMLAPYGTLNKVSTAIIIAVGDTRGEDRTFTYDDLSKNMKSIIPKEEFETQYENYNRIDEKTVKQYYKKLFGEEMPKQEQTLKEGLYYDSVDNYFYLDRKMWWSSNYAHIVYINRIEEQGDKAYAYINVGNVKSMASSIGPGYTVDIYNDFSGDNFVETKEVPIEIDETNYTKYQEYKYTFKKADENGNYYLVSIDKN